MKRFIKLASLGPCIVMVSGCVTHHANGQSEINWGIAAIVWAVTLALVAGAAYAVGQALRG